MGKVYSICFNLFHLIIIAELGQWKIPDLSFILISVTDLDPFIS